MWLLYRDVHTLISHLGLFGMFHTFTPISTFNEFFQIFYLLVCVILFEL